MLNVKLLVHHVTSRLYKVKLSNDVGFIEFNTEVQWLMSNRIQRPSTQQSEYPHFGDTSCPVIVREVIADLISRIRNSAL